MLIRAGAFIRMSTVLVCFMILKPNFWNTLLSCQHFAWNKRGIEMSHRWYTRWIRSDILWIRFLKKDSRTLPDFQNGFPASEINTSANPLISVPFLSSRRGHLELHVGVLFFNFGSLAMCLLSVKNSSYASANRVFLVVFCGISGEIFRGCSVLDFPYSQYSRVPINNPGNPLIFCQYSMEYQYSAECWNSLMLALTVA